MTSEIDVSKTNEFQRRRKLRLQQVREQSKDIAKKIRQRAKVEKLRNVLNIDAKKEQQYFELQDKLVGRLEKLYSQNLQNVGVGHKNASNIKESDKEIKTDLSKSRGREAVAELRKRKQEKLDEQKKILDRKLQAREAANELSREKCTVVAKALSSKSVENLQANNIDICNNNIEKDCLTDKDKDIINSDIPKNDMGTQWEEDELSNEWALPVPSLSLPKDDKDSYKDSGNDGEKSDKNKRINLFAISDEMPSSLRGGLSSVQTDVPSVKPSMTLISEYLLSRSLRLRENVPVASTKKPDDFQSIKQTILRSRASRPDVSGKSDQSRITKDITLDKKNSVTMYNHSTRDTRDIAYNNDAVVIRENNTADDAYTKALKETSMINEMQNKELERKKEDMRNKVAMTKEKVDKEFRDTLAFLNSLSKDTTSRVQKIAHMDEDRQQMQQEKHQRRMQDEFRKIERESAVRSCKHSKKQPIVLNRSRSKSRSPDKLNFNENILPRNFQYDWMPVPESDGNLAVHTIASTKNPKSSNTVKFNDVDTYHEYRSRHKHTPPTKDVSKDRERKRIVETVILQQNSNETTDASSVTSDVSIDEQRMDDKHKTEKEILDDPRLSDGDRIVIYKILDSKRDKRSKGDKKSKAINKIFKSLSSLENGDISSTRKSQSNEKNQSLQKENENDSHRLENLSEGIYKVGENGDNIASMYFTDKKQTACSCKEQERTTSSSTKCMKNTKGSEQVNTESEGNKSRTQHQCTGCKCACSNTQNTQASTATSTSSFQTASNDKGANILCDGGFLKLVDDAGQDTGKFYIGASGFLKDDKYEVVIQLKKKDTDQIQSKSQEVNVNIVDELPTPSKNLSKVDTEVQSSSNNLKESAAQTSITNECIVDAGPSQSKSEPSLIKSGQIPGLGVNKLNTEQKKEHETEVDNNNDNNNITQESTVTPTVGTKIEQVSRPATSTYTQTSFSSPNSRPVFLHMTSSTSTAYMSPPELIMPRYLKKTRTSSFHDDRQSNKYDKYDEDCVKVNKKCKCKHSRCISTEKTRKCRHMCSNTDTPPNTAHSYDYGSFSENIESEKLQQKPHGTCRRVHKHKNHFTMHKSSSKSSARGSVLMNKNFHKLYNTRQMSLNKSCFNPVVKQYVNKLLSLNKESLKAIQVVNQDCSAVDTPGSSIINNPFNFGDQISPLQNKISLQQIKIMLEQQIIREQAKKYGHHFEISTGIKHKNVLNLPKRKQIHKVKSLNISKRILKNKHIQNVKQHAPTQTTDQPESTSSSMKEPSSPKQLNKDETDCTKKAQLRRQSSTTSSTRNIKNHKDDCCSSTHALKNFGVTVQPSLNYSSDGTYRSNELYKLPPRRTTLTSGSSESLRKRNSTKHNSQLLPTDISTQTSGIDSEINYMKLAENKLQNMEKIADLTEKCTKRLSNLAKVLEEVRRNKSVVYSHISTSDSITSDSEPKISNADEKRTLSGEVTPDVAPNPSIAFPNKTSEEKDLNFVPLLKDIPKPLSPSTLSLSTISEKSNTIPSTIISTEQIKNKKPPPALSRVYSKETQDLQAVPHELSTVIEVDSPMSLKSKNQSSRHEVIQEVGSNKIQQIHKLNENSNSSSKYDTDPDLIHSKTDFITQQPSNSVDNQKVQIMDMRLFNDIMLKPFLSLQEYAKQRDLRIEEGSNVDDVLKDEPIQEELSSLHSDGSLPDVISELLKRKIIAEPFQFDTASHVNTTSMSSESSLSLLALSKIRKEKKKSKNLFINKENVGETSETLSISSNPDLENAFQKLGMGWASSTLKKTKERLALSSSSNTSSSSVGHLKFKSYNKDIATITTTESTISEINKSYKKSHQPENVDTSKNAEQQTSLINSMTVKEFLTNELAKKITFTNKSSRRNEEEFVSLYETKMPEEIKNASEIGEHERTITSQSNNRARTSTPVQIFKSTTYQSTSSTNTSNGLFSNADELSSVKVTSNSIRNHSTSDKDDLTIPNYTLKRTGVSDYSKSE